MKDSKYEEGLHNGSLRGIEEIYSVLERDKEKVYEIIRVIEV